MTKTGGLSWRGEGKVKGREKRTMGKSGQRLDLPPRRLYAMIDVAKDGAANDEWVDRGWACISCALSSLCWDGETLGRWCRDARAEKSGRAAYESGRFGMLVWSGREGER